MTYILKYKSDTCEHSQGNEREYFHPFFSVEHAVETGGQLQTRIQAYDMYIVDYETDAIILSDLNRIIPYIPVDPKGKYF